MPQPRPGDGAEPPRAANIDPDSERANPGPRWRQPRLPTVVAAVAVGGAIGTEARYGLGVALPHGPAQWPWATLLTNIGGCFLISVLMVTITELVDAHPLIRPLLGVGFLGGYTTFSTYSVDVITLAHAGRWPLALGYLVATPALAVLAAAAGAAVTRRLAAGGGRRPRPTGCGPGAADRPGAASADPRQRPAGEDTEGGRGK